MASPSAIGDAEAARDKDHLHHGRSDLSPRDFIDTSETPLLGKPIHLKTLPFTVEAALAPRK
jgi:hypothetical protein